MMDLNRRRISKRVAVRTVEIVVIVPIDIFRSVSWGKFVHFFHVSSFSVMLKVLSVHMPILSTRLLFTIRDALNLRCCCCSSRSFPVGILEIAPRPLIVSAKLKTS